METVIQLLVIIVVTFAFGSAIGSRFPKVDRYAGWAAVIAGAIGIATHFN